MAARRGSAPGLALRQSPAGPLFKAFAENQCIELHRGRLFTNSKTGLPRNEGPT